MNTLPLGPRVFAWAGAGLFAAALSYFLFSYAVTFGEITPGHIDVADAVVDVALFSIFALHHSIFAREAVRARVKRAFSPAVERSIYVWAASLMLIAVCALWRPVAGVLWQLNAPWSWLLVGAQFAAVWLTLRSAAIIDIWALAGVRPARDSDFKIRGPYGWVRHPIYSGWVMLVFAVGTMTMTRFVFAAVSSVYILIAIPFEERSLRATAGEAYAGYTRTVRWKLIPGLY